MKEMYEPYQENFLTRYDHSLIGFSEPITRNETGSQKDDRLRPAGNSFIQSKREDDQNPVLPVNNYLKSAEEIEVEFIYMMNTCKTNPGEKDNIWNTYDCLTKKNTESAAIRNPNNVLSGSMEENY